MVDGLPNAGAAEQGPPSPPLAEGTSRSITLMPVTSRSVQPGLFVIEGPRAMDGGGVSLASTGARTGIPWGTPRHGP